MKSKGLNLVEIKIDRQKIVEGNEQVIFKPTDVLEKKIIEMKLIENKKDAFGGIETKGKMKVLL